MVFLDLVWSLALCSPELGRKQREVFAVSFGEEVMGFLLVCLSRDGIVFLLPVVKVAVLRLCKGEGYLSRMKPCGRESWQ